MVKVARTGLSGGGYYRPLPVDVQRKRVIDDIPEDPPAQDGPESGRTDYTPSCGVRYLMSYTIQELSNGDWKWRVYDESGSEGIMMKTGTYRSPSGLPSLPDGAISAAKAYIQSRCPLPPQDDDEDDRGDSNGDDNGGGNGGGNDNGNGETESQKYEFVFIGIIAMAVLAHAFLGGE